jgi:hypothetical protein
MSCPTSSSCSTPAVTDSCTSTATPKVYTDGYTEGRRNTHVATVAVFILIGVAMCAIGFMYRDDAKVLLWTLVGTGAVIIVVMLLALIPICGQPIVAGRQFTVDAATGCPVDC